MRMCVSLPERHNSRTAQQVVDINFAVVGISCSNAGSGVGADETSNGLDDGLRFTGQTPNVEVPSKFAHRICGFLLLAG